MPQPKIDIASGRIIARFGGQALPNGQGAQPTIDLNDQVNTSLQDFASDDDNVKMTLAQLLYRGEAAYLDQDFDPRKYALPIIYYEDSTHFLGQLLAQLSQAGEQQLTFDGVTYNLVRYAGALRRSLRKRYPNFAYDIELEFVARIPFWQDASAQSATVATITVDAGQSFSISYLGSIWAAPIWTIVIPNTNTVAINSMQLKNTMSGEFLTVDFLSVAAIPASTARTITIDSGAQTVIDNAGNAYNHYGSFPKLYPPVGQNNPFTVIMIPASGSTSGITVAHSHYPRWQI